MKRLAVGLSIFIVGMSAFAAEPAPSADLARAEVHRNKARILIEQNDWSGAAAEIRLATQLNPKSADSWLILGTVTMRLEANAEALDAFSKYLELNPPEEKASAVRQRVAALEVRLDKQRKLEEEANQAAAKAKAERFGPGGAGFFVGYSPSYKPKIGTISDLNSTISSSWDFGFRIKTVDVGIRFGSGTVDQITVKDSAAVVTGPFSGGKHSLYELYARIYLPLGAPGEGKAGLQFLIPLHLGVYYNNVQFEKTYWNMGYNAGSGGQIRYYTGSHFVFDVSGLYCFSFPLTAIQNNDAKTKTAINTEGNKAAGNLEGFELRAGITILF